MLQRNQGGPFGSRQPRTPRNPFFPSSPYKKNASHVILDYFKNNDGRWDIDKISQSIGQVNKIVKQADPLVKQMTSIVKKTKPK